MEFKILNYRNREEYPNNYKYGKQEFYIKHVKVMEQKYNISLPRIKEVIIGDSEYPFTEVYFEGGLVLYDEEVSPHWTQNENKKRISN
jgi:hypothetical protein